jgi:hypothetical protein
VQGRDVYEQAVKMLLFIHFVCKGTVLVVQLLLQFCVYIGDWPILQ